MGSMGLGAWTKGYTPQRAGPDLILYLSSWRHCPCGEEAAQWLIAPGTGSCREMAEVWLQLLVTENWQEVSFTHQTGNALSLTLRICFSRNTQDTVYRNKKKEFRFLGQIIAKCLEPCLQCFLQSCIVINVYTLLYSLQSAFHVCAHLILPTT